MQRLFYIFYPGLPGFNSTISARLGENADHHVTTLVHKGNRVIIEQQLRALKKDFPNVRLKAVPDATQGEFLNFIATIKDGTANAFVVRCENDSIAYLGDRLMPKLKEKGAILFITNENTHSFSQAESDMQALRRRFRREKRGVLLHHIHLGKRQIDLSLPGHGRRLPGPELAEKARTTLLSRKPASVLLS